MRPIAGLVPFAFEPTSLSNDGACGADKQPAAMMQNRAETSSPRSVRIFQRPDVSSNIASVTRVESWMSRRRSNRSATWLMYFRISGCDA
jgi:hypothetical protein